QSYDSIGRPENGLERIGGRFNSNAIMLTTLVQLLTRLIWFHAFTHIHTSFFAPNRNTQQILY
ncbi:MAG: hypothetical protein QF817_01660, partial [Candidatus Poseidoniaceae archaeon]|nr:hypothetical protein [Candidatus Poseidoniaceae archaeon]